MPDLVDYLRDKLEHADDAPAITIMRPSGYFWRDTKGNLTPFDDVDAEQTFRQELQDYWLHDRVGSRPLSFWLLPKRKRWWRR